MNSRRLVTIIAALAAVVVVLALVSRSNKDSSSDATAGRPATTSRPPAGRTTSTVRPGTTAVVPTSTGGTTVSSTTPTTTPSPAPARPDPALGRDAFDLVPGLRTGAGIGVAQNLSEYVDDAGVRNSSVIIKFDGTVKATDGEKAFDPIFTAAGYTKGEVVRQDFDPAYLLIRYHRSSIDCSVIYSSTFGALYQVSCSG